MEGEGYDAHGIHFPWKNFRRWKRYTDKAIRAISLI